MALLEAISLSDLEKILTGLKPFQTEEYQLDSMAIARCGLGTSRKWKLDYFIHSKQTEMFQII